MEALDQTTFVFVVMCDDTLFAYSSRKKAVDKAISLCAKGYGKILHADLIVDRDGPDLDEVKKWRKDVLGEASL